MNKDDHREIEEMIFQEAEDELEAEELLSIAKNIISIKPARPSEDFKHKLKAQLEQKVKEQSSRPASGKENRVISPWKVWMRPISMVATAAAFALILNASGMLGLLTSDEGENGPISSKSPGDDDSQGLVEESPSPGESIEIALKNGDSDDKEPSQETQGHEGDTGDAEEDNGDSGLEIDSEEEKEREQPDEPAPDQPSTESESKDTDKEDGPGEIIISSEALGDLSLNGRRSRLSPLVLGDSPLAEPAKVNYVLQRFPEFPEEKPLYSSNLKRWSEEEALLLGQILDFEREPIEADGDLVFREEDDQGGRLLSFFIDEGRLIYYCYFNSQDAQERDTSKEKLIDAKQALAAAEAFMEDINVKPGKVASFEEGMREGRHYWEVIFYPNFLPEKGIVTLSVARVDKADSSIIYFSHEEAGLEAREYIDVKDEEAFVNSLKQVEVFAPKANITLLIKEVDLVYMQREIRAALHRTSWEPYFLLRGVTEEGEEEFTYYLPAEK